MVFEGFEYINVPSVVDDQIQVPEASIDHLLVAIQKIRRNFDVSQTCLVSIIIDLGTL